MMVGPTHGVVRFFLTSHFISAHAFALSNERSERNETAVYVGGRASGKPRADCFALLAFGDGWTCQIRFRSRVDLVEVNLGNVLQTKVDYVAFTNFWTWEVAEVTPKTSPK